MDSLLDTVKQSVNVDPTDTSFDLEILLSINLGIFKLQQLGLTKLNTLNEITDNKTTWQEVFAEYPKELGAIKALFKINARLEFDPPASSFAITALQDQKKEIEWRLNTQVEGGIIV